MELCDADTPWKPEWVAEGSERWEQLRADAATAVIDTLNQQRRDLGTILPEPNAAHLVEPARWLHYPWRRSLIRLLGPEGFRALRSDRNRNKITVDEQRQLRGLSVGVVGLSSGHAIALALALEGICGELRLADFDVIELSNLNRVPATVFDLGMNKAVVAARRIAELDPYIDVRTWPDGLKVDGLAMFIDGLDIVVEQCDSFDLKLAVREEAKHRGVPVVMSTSDRGLLDVERYDVEPERRLFHGLLGDLRPADLVGMSPADSRPYVMRVLEAERVSMRLAQSMNEINKTLSTWPQLSTDIELGAAMVTAAVRLIGLGAPVPSGRVRVDVEAILGRASAPVVDHRSDGFNLPGEGSVA